jgi:hypothetical protein
MQNGGDSGSLKALYGERLGTARVNGHYLVPEARFCE